MKKVIIGIVAKHRDVSKKRTDTLIRDEIKDVVFYNGAIAIGIVPSMKEITTVDLKNQKEIYKNINRLFTQKEQHDMISQIELCDGIILGGGIKSDAYEIWIAKYCYERDVPVLAICAGENNLVRAVGGTIKEVDNPELHNQQTIDYAHYIKINKNSKLYKLLRVESLNVNSRHKCVVDNTAILDVAATDETGNIEAVEDKSKKCFIGVRFHPESLYLIDKIHNKLIKKFIEICKKK